MPTRTSRFRGGRTHGRGNAGLHKHRYITTVKHDPKHFGRHGFSRPQSVVASPVVINVGELEEFVDAWVKEGAAKGSGGSYQVDLGALGIDKLLGTGSVSASFKITVAEASDRAVEKISGAGGSVKTLRSRDGGDQ